MSGKLLLKLDAIAFLLTHHTSGARASPRQAPFRLSTCLHVAAFKTAGFCT